MRGKMRLTQGSGKFVARSLPMGCVRRVTADAGRLDAFVGRLELVGSRARAQKLIDQGLVKVHGKPAKASHKLGAGDVVSTWIPAAVPLALLPQDIPLDIIYEDQHIVVVNKARGMVVHPGAGNPTGTLVNGLLYHCGDLPGIGGVLRPGIVHRIDKDTSGVLVVAKTDSALAGLSAQLKAHTVVRVYCAIVAGVPKVEQGRVATQIGRHPTDRKRMAVLAKGGRHAITNWRVVEAFGRYSMIEARLETGRTHQIRVHMAYIGHPLVGDPVYGRRDGSPRSAAMNRFIHGQALHAATLGFTHPATGVYMEFSAPIPGDMQAMLRSLRNDPLDASYDV